MKKYEYVEINYNAKGVVFLCTDKHKEIIDSYAKTGYHYAGFVPEFRAMLQDTIDKTMESTDPDVQANFKRYFGNKRPTPEEYIYTITKKTKVKV